MWMESACVQFLYLGITLDFFHVINLQPKAWLEYDEGYNDNNCLNGTFGSFASGKWFELTPLHFQLYLYGD